MGDKALKLVEENDIQTRAVLARAHLADLQKAARSAEDAAQKAALLFAHDPRGKGTLAERDITAQEAINARENASGYELSIAQLIAEAAQEKLAKDHEVAAARVQSNCFEEQRQRLEDLAAEFRRALRGGIVNLQDGIKAHNGHVSAANRLAEQLGRPERYTLRTLDDVIETIAISLNGGVRPAIGYTTPIDFKSFSTDGSEQKRRLVFSINEPLTQE